MQKTEKGGKGERKVEEERIVRYEQTNKQTRIIEESKEKKTKDKKKRKNKYDGK